MFPRPCVQGSHEWGGPRTLLVMVALVVLAGCATGTPRGGWMSGRAGAQRVGADALLAPIPEAPSGVDEDEVGPFYAMEGGRLWPVDAELEVPRAALPLGPYVPDDGVVLPALEGAGLALVDTVEGLYRLVFHTGDTLKGLTRLPGAVRQLVQNAPEYWVAFRHKPPGEQVRDISRLTAHVLLMVGSGGAGAGTGAAKAGSVGGRLGRLAAPVFSLTGEGVVALRLVGVPGRVVALAGEVLNATYVLSVATTGAVAVSGGRLILTPERFNGHEPEYVALADRLRASLDGAGLLKESIISPRAPT
ncbi:Imm52 family immunity protein [Archangium sp.]|uniref:Imm52 family immunity protein n=1 Tax=Archangium sp. TaxID=1872627 RepID=UPI002ED9021F